MFKTDKQALNLEPYFVTPIPFLTLWVTLSCFLILILGVEIIKEKNKDVIPELEEALSKITKDKRELFEEMTKHKKYQSHEELGNLVGIIPKNKFFQESQRSFTHELKGLSKIEIKNLWFTNIVFDRKNNMLSLKGNALNPHLVNRFLSAMKIENSFEEYNVDDFLPITDGSSAKTRKKNKNNGKAKTYEFAIKNYK